MAYRNRAQLYRSKRDYRELADLSEAIRLIPNDAALFHDRGTANLDSKKYDQAIADFSELIRLRSGTALHAEAHYLRGTARLQGSRYDDAIADFTKAMQLNAEGAKYYYGPRGRAYSGKRAYDKAIEDFTEAIRHFPNDWLNYQDRADAYDRRGNFGDGIRAGRDRAKVSDLKRIRL